LVTLANGSVGLTEAVNVSAKRNLAIPTEAGAPATAQRRNLLFF
jgi:hypothetical protein